MTHDGTPPTTAFASDGRSTRWQDHRARRRSEIVDAAIRAIREHGPGVGMDEIAVAAGTSKTVVYRHLGDKAGLYEAILERIDERVVSNVAAAVRHSPQGPRSALQAVSATIDAYLALVESDMALYRFIVDRPNIALPGTENPVRRTVGAVTDLLETALAQAIHAGGTTPDPARTRVAAIALVGAVDAAADDWLSHPRRMPRHELVAILSELAAGVTRLATA